jgi:hypothetical protein
MLNVQLNIENYGLNILLKHEVRHSTGSGRPEPVEERFTRNAPPPLPSPIYMGEGWVGDDERLSG